MHCKALVYVFKRLAPSLGVVGGLGLCLYRYYVISESRIVDSSSPGNVSFKGTEVLVCARQRQTTLGLVSVVHILSGKDRCVGGPLVECEALPGSIL